MGIDSRLQDIQKSSNSECSASLQRQIQAGSGHVAEPACQSRQSTADHDHALHACGRAQRRYRHGETLNRQAQAMMQGDALVLEQLTSHVRKSLPGSQSSSQTILCKSWLAVHRKVAGIALAKAHQSARRHGLTQVEDTRGFLASEVAWYGAFCSFSRVICRMVGIKPVKHQQ
jgi:hypothetical protein